MGLFDGDGLGGLLGNFGSQEAAGTGILGGLSRNSDALALIGLGLASSPRNNPMQGIMQGYAAGSQLDNKREEASTSRKAIYTALVARGVEPKMAMAASANPAAAQIMIQQADKDREAREHDAFTSGQPRSGSPAPTPVPAPAPLGLGGGVKSDVVPNATVASVSPFHDLLGGAEGTDKGRGFNETLAYGKFTGGPVELTGMKVGDVLGLQKQMLQHPQNGFNSSAAGRYQVVGKTLRGLVDQGVVSPDDPYNEETQNKIAAHLAKQRGPDPAALRAEWAGLKNVPDDKIVSAWQASFGQSAQAPAAASPVQVASADPNFVPTTPEGRMAALAGGQGAPTQGGTQVAQAGGADRASLEKQRDYYEQWASNPRASEATRAVALRRLQSIEERLKPTEIERNVDGLGRLGAVKPEDRADAARRLSGLNKESEWKPLNQKTGDGEVTVAYQHPSGKIISAAEFNKAFGVDASAAGGSKFSREVAQREVEADRLGLKKGDPRRDTFLLTGKMPREDAQPLSATDKKAIMEADELVLSNTTAIEALKRAKALSAKAYDGPLAAQRGTIAGNFGSERGQATTEMDNEVKANALSQMKAIFGGNPTEGERAVLLEIQGSSNQPKAVREKIYDKAIALAEKRLEFNRQRAKELRGGDYYKPDDKKSGVASPKVFQHQSGATIERID